MPPPLACSVCNKTQSPEKKLQRCSRCRDRFYCGKSRIVLYSRYYSMSNLSWKIQGPIVRWLTGLPTNGPAASPTASRGTTSTANVMMAACMRANSSWSPGTPPPMVKRWGGGMSPSRSRRIWRRNSKESSREIWRSYIVIGPKHLGGLVAGRTRIWSSGVIITERAVSRVRAISAGAFHSFLIRCAVANILTKGWESLSRIVSTMIRRRHAWDSDCHAVPIRDHSIVLMRR